MASEVPKPSARPGPAPAGARAGAALLPAWRRAGVVPVGLFLLVGLVLFLLGLHGQRQARLRADLEDLSTVSEQIRRSLEDELGLAGLLLGTEGEPGAAAVRRPPLSPDTEGHADNLRSLLLTFEARHGTRRLAPADDLDLRLARATLANLERRYDQALAAVTAEDERVAGDIRVARVWQARGEAFHGLGQWPEVLALFQQAVARQPGRLDLHARLADSQLALGHRAEAAAGYAEVARARVRRGSSLMLRDRPVAAAREYRHALELQLRLVQALEPGLADETALTHDLLGHALLLANDPAAAAAQYAQALVLREALAGRGSEAGLARSRGHLGHALLLQGQPDEAAAQYRQALSLLNLAGPEARPAAASLELNLGNAALGQQRLDEAARYFALVADRLAGDAGPEAAKELALSRNNLGVVRLLQGGRDAAVESFAAALAALAPLRADSGAGRPPHRAADPLRLDLRLDLVAGQDDSGLQMLARVRLAGQHERREAAVAAAVVHANRAAVHQENGDLPAALHDFAEAGRLFGALVEREGQGDLAGELAASLTAQARLLTSGPDPALREPTRAQVLAFRAAELMQWKSPTALDALAAAAAARGDFADAVRWQEMAVRVAEGPARAELAARLELYRRGSVAGRP